MIQRLFFTVAACLIALSMAIHWPAVAEFRDLSVSAHLAAYSGPKQHSHHVDETSASVSHVHRHRHGPSEPEHEHKHATLGFANTLVQRSYLVSTSFVTHRLHLLLEASRGLQ